MCIIWNAFQNTVDHLYNEKLSITGPKNNQLIVNTSKKTNNLQIRIYPL